MKITKQQLSDIIYVPVIKDDLDRLASEARAALEAGTLEIEGYERATWTRFDVNNPKTFPPKTGEYVVAIEGRSTSTTRKFSTEYSEFFAPEKITHWRPLPKPPVESEEKYES